MHTMHHALALYNTVRENMPQPASPLFSSIRGVAHVHVGRRPRPSLTCALLPVL